MKFKRNAISVESMFAAAVGAVVIIGLLCVILSIGCKACGGLNLPYSEGTRSGVVQKISKKGLIWSTWDGELNLGYNRSVSTDAGSQIVPAIWQFSVSSDMIAERIQEAERSGQRVTLGYRQFFLHGWDKGATSYDVNTVQTFDKKGGE